MKRLVVAIAAAALATPACGGGLDKEVFYQIFTRSMRDSNGDRQGDLKGIEQSLPYLQKLGVTSILLTPIQPSPFYHNYFPDRPGGIDPSFGTMNDFTHLAKAVHARAMKLYLDEEFQYVAYDHPWFASALGNPRSPYSSFFFFQGPGNTKPVPGPFGITIAQRFPGDQTGITTLNMHEPAFKRWAAAYLKDWIDPNGDGDFSDGVDGFRLDHMMDDLDNKHIDTNLFATFWKPLFADLKAVNPKLVFIAEQWDWGYGSDFLARGGADAVFDFPLARAIRSFDKAQILAAVEETAKSVGPGKHELIFIENHDTSRTASDPKITPEKLRTAATLSLLLKGTPLIYYGQELGMRGKPRDEYKSDEKDIGDREAFKWKAASEAAGQANWYEGPKSYWTQRFAKDGDGVSVEEEERDPKSLLNHYRWLLKLRASHPALVSGDQRIMPMPGNILAVERTLGNEHLLILANLSPKPAQYSISGTDLISGRRYSGKLQLAPYAAKLVSR